MRSLTIVSRNSVLAVWQANFVAQLLQQRLPSLNITLTTVKTLADKFLESPLQKIGGKGIFVKELQQALLEKRADLAVHSLKDMPAEHPEGLCLAAVCARENPLDALVSPRGWSFSQLPLGAKVGTSSLRRIVQLQKIRPDLHYVPIRGNIDTRIQKCQRGDFDAIVLAAAGLSRLALTHHITGLFSSQEVIPAVGQGALGLECRSDDQDLRTLLMQINDLATWTCIIAERRMNAELGGSCQVPIGGFAEISNERLLLRGCVGDNQGTLLFAQAEGLCQHAEALGQQVAHALLAQGAASIIANIKGQL